MVSKDWEPSATPWISTAQADDDDSDRFYWLCSLCEIEDVEFTPWDRDYDIEQHVEQDSDHRSRMARCNTWCGPTPSAGTIWGYCFLPLGHDGNHAREIFPWETRMNAYG